MTAARQDRSIAALIACLAGPVIWAAHFFLLYGLEAPLCSRAGFTNPAALFGTIASVATAGALAALTIVLTMLLRRAARRGSTFLNRIATGLALLATAGVLWVAMPAVLLQACAQEPEILQK